MTPDPHVLLEASGISKLYRNRAGEEIAALAAGDVRLVQGEFVSVVGPSGCGKSTLMKILAGIVPPSTGSLVRHGGGDRSAQRQVGVVFQSPVLLPWLTILDNVLLPSRVMRLDRKAATARAHDLLTLVGLGGFAHSYPSELSGGMQQRVGIIRSLIHDPDLLLMDEPFGALDALTRERMSLELQSIWLTHRKTVFFITHSILESVFLSDRVLVMSPRPGQITHDIRIPFARPRDFDLTTTAEFGRFVGQIRHILGASVDA
jgi:NitT/TauT family transport system ATP-binding protein